MAPYRRQGDKKPLSTENSGKIIAFSTLGWSSRKISEKMNDEFGVAVTYRTVQNIVNRNKKSGSITRKKNPGSGRPKKTTVREDRVLKRLAFSNRKQSIRQLANSMNESTGIQLSKRTIRRRLKEFDIRSYPCAKKPLVSRANRSKRRKWALKYSAENMEYWKRVLWSDESRFCMVSDRPQRCLRMPHERLKPECLQSTVKFGGGGIMVWGVFSYNGVGELHWVKGKIDTSHYLRILNQNLFKSIKNLHPDGRYVFQQDNAPVHVSKKAKIWFNRKKLDVMIDWPPQSPDMNPIEHIWEYIARRIERETFTKEEDLFNRIKEVWNSLPIDFLHNLVDSIPDRIRELRSRYGGPTSY